ncbi:MAG: amidohydrolase [Chloroflexi bacterium]|nr:amidohydrolase [Chloroflexota bacterium]
MNGRVLTCDSRQPSAAAVAVRDARIVAVGEAAAVQQHLIGGATSLDLGGRTMVPGFIDAHNHMACTAETFFAIDAGPRSVSSITELVTAVAEAATDTPPGAWIRGFGMDWTRFAEGRRPTRWDLDEAGDQHPVVILHVSGHYALVNSRALADSGLSEDARDPEGGSLERDESGRLTGLLLDSATNLVLQTSVDICGHGPNIHTAVDTDELARMIGEASRRYLAAGLTTICDPQVTSREMAAYQFARAQGDLPIRTVMLPLSHQLDEYLAIGLVGPMGDDHLRIGAMKFYTDGAITGGTAMFSKPMGSRGQYPGSLYHQPAELADLLRRAAGAGWQLAIHTMGDRAMGIMLDAVEAAMAAAPDGDIRHRIEHSTWPTPEQLARIARLGMVPVTQPGSIAELGDIWHDHLGERVHRAMPLRDQLELGIRPAISSDAFVQSYRPLDTIAAAMQRVTPSGFQVGPDQELTIEEALAAHTINAARAIHMEDRIGSIEVGKLADFAVLDGDLLATPAEDIRRIPIWMTVIGGEPLHPGS